MIERIRPQSSAVRAMGPSLSMVHAMDMAPWRLTRPKLGRMPEMPHHEVGQMMEPRVSDPMAHGARPAATIAPEPLEDPQVQHSVFQGLRAAPVRAAKPLEYPSPPASSIMAALPMSTLPAAFSFSTM